MQHDVHLQRLAAAIRLTEQELHDLEQTRASVAADVAEHSVQEQLGTAGAADAVAAGKARLGTFEREIAQRRERLDSQREAHQRLTTRSAAIRAAIEAEIQQAVQHAHVAC